MLLQNKSRKERHANQEREELDRESMRNAIREKYGIKRKFSSGPDGQAIEVI